MPPRVHSVPARNAAPSRARRRAPVCLGAAVLLLAVLLAGCDLFGSGEQSDTPAATGGQQAAAPADTGGDRDGAAGGANPFAAQDPGDSDRPVIVALGDSLTAGFGLHEDEAWPALLQAKLRAEGYPHRVVNAGVSGDTTADARTRLDWVLRQRVDILIVALGGNDGLRALDPAAMRDNLAAIVERAQGRGIRVLLAGMKMPVNYGKDYRRRFEAVYHDLAETYDVRLLPFLLEGVAGRPALNQADGIHPTAAGQRIIMQNVWEALEPML